MRNNCFNGIRCWKALAGFVCFIAILNSCSKNEFYNKNELFEYVTDESNGYLQRKEVKGLFYSLLYRPTDLLVSQDLEDPGKQNISGLRNKYKKYMYFNLSLSYQDQELLSTLPKNKEEFSSLVNLLSFGMDEKVFLYTQTKDTIQITDYIYPRMYGKSHQTTLMLIYPRDKKIMKGDFLNLTIQDLDIGLNTGEVHFKIPLSLIRNEPTIQFKD